MGTHVPAATHSFAQEPERSTTGPGRPNRAPANPAGLAALQRMAGNRAVSRLVCQRTLAVESDQYSDFVHEQRNKQDAVKDGKAEEPFTTVGFEHEFCGHTGPLQGISHLTVAKAEPPLPYTGLPFEVETDAANVLELVTPPFLLPTKDASTPVPRASEVQKVVNMAHAALTKATSGDLALSDLLVNLNKLVGPSFALADGVDIKAENISHKSKQKPDRISAMDLGSIPIVPMTKHHGSIATQVNIATNFAVFNKLASRSGDLIKPTHEKPRKFHQEIEHRIYDGMHQSTIGETILDQCERLMVTTVANQLGVFMQGLLAHYQRDRWFPQPELFKAKLADIFAGKPDAPEVDSFADAILNSRDQVTWKSIHVRIEQEGRRPKSEEARKRAEAGKAADAKKFKEATPDEREKLREAKKLAAENNRKETEQLAEQVFYAYQSTVYNENSMGMAARLSSYVKDVHGVWPKDSWENLIFGALLGHARAFALKHGKDEPRALRYLRELLLPALRIRLEKRIRPAVEKLDLTDLLGELPWSARLLAVDVKSRLLAAVDTMYGVLAHDFLDVLSTRARMPPEVAEILAWHFLPHRLRRFAGPPSQPQPGLYGHDRDRVGARQDTYLDPSKIQGPADKYPQFGTLFVVESRGGIDDFIKVLGEI